MHDARCIFDECCEKKKYGEKKYLRSNFEVIASSENLFVEFYNYYCICVHRIAQHQQVCSCPVLFRLISDARHFRMIHIWEFIV